MPDERPEPRDVTVSFRVDADTAEAARSKASKQRRKLGAILRAFVLLWANDEYPDPPILDDEETRAAKRPRPRRRRRR